MKYEEIEGNLITLAQEGKFDVIVHGCNCFCVQGAGLAPQMVKAFGTDKFPMEIDTQGDINKLGQIDYKLLHFSKKSGKQLSASTLLMEGTNDLYVVNAYTQYNYGANHADGDKAPVDYDAISLCMKKINHMFKGKHIGLPQIGCGLAGGDWKIVQYIILKELKDVDVTVIIFKK